MGNIANQIHGFTIYYGKFILKKFSVHVSISKKQLRMSRRVECNKICRTNDKNIYEVKKGT